MNSTNKFIFSVAFVCTLASTQAISQDSYDAWLAAGQPAIAPTGVDAPAGMGGGLIQFADQATFDSSTGAVVLETFDNGLTAPTSVITCNDIISSATTGPCFNAGDLVPGFSMTFIDNGGLGGFVALGAGILGPGQTTVTVGANSFIDNTEINFSPAVTAVAFDAFGVVGDYLVTAFDGDGTSIGSVTVTGTAGDSPAFVGFSSEVPVAAVIVDGVGGAGEVIDNLQFGSAASLPESVPVPTLDQFGLWILAALMLVIGVLGYRRFSA